MAWLRNTNFLRDQNSPVLKDTNCKSSELNHHIQTIRNRLMRTYSEITEINLHLINKPGKSGQGLEKSHLTLGQKYLLKLSYKCKRTTIFIFVNDSDCQKPAAPAVTQLWKHTVILAFPSFSNHISLFVHITVS